jgi:hypothetical protein
VPEYEIFEPVLLYQIKGEIKPFVADSLILSIAEGKVLLHCQNEA